MHGQTSGSKWTDTDDIEIRAYIEFLIEAGIRKQGLYDYDDFWDPLFGTALYRASMSKTDFLNYVPIYGLMTLQQDHYEKAKINLHRLEHYGIKSILIWGSTTFQRII